MKVYHNADRRTIWNKGDGTAATASSGQLGRKPERLGGGSGDNHLQAGVGHSELDEVRVVLPDQALERHY
jgi:hypothetical protein